jgi:hypothetical protein
MFAAGTGGRFATCQLQSPTTNIPVAIVKTYSRFKTCPTTVACGIAVKQIMSGVSLLRQPRNRFAVINLMRTIDLVVPSYGLRQPE